MSALLRLRHAAGGARCSGRQVMYFRNSIIRKQTPVLDVARPREHSLNMQPREEEDSHPNGTPPMTPPPPLPPASPNCAIVCCSELPDIDPGDLVLIRQSILRPFGSGKRFLLRPLTAGQGQGGTGHIF